MQRATTNCLHDFRSMVKVVEFLVEFLIQESRSIDHHRLEPWTSPSAQRPQRNLADASTRARVSAEGASLGLVEGLTGPSSGRKRAPLEWPRQDSSPLWARGEDSGQILVNIVHSNVSQRSM